MDVIDLRTRTISSEGKFSFQVYNGITNYVIWASPEWWDKEETAKEWCDRIRDHVRNDMRGLGIVVLKNIEGRDFVFTPTTQGEVMKEIAIMVVLAINRKSGKFGTAVLTNNNVVLIKPNQYFDTPEEAFTIAKQLHNAIVKAVEEQGLCKLSVTEPKIADFIPPPADLEKAVEALRTDKDQIGPSMMELDNKLVQTPHIKNPWNIGGKGSGPSIN